MNMVQLEAEIHRSMVAHDAIVRADERKAVLKEASKWLLGHPILCDVTGPDYIEVEVPDIEALARGEEPWEKGK